MSFAVLPFSTAFLDPLHRVLAHTSWSLEQGGTTDRLLQHGCMPITAPTSISRTVILQ